MTDVEVYLNGHRVIDMASEPVFSTTLEVIQRYYELQKENKNHTFLIMALNLQ